LLALLGGELSCWFFYDAMCVLGLLGGKVSCSFF